VVTGTCLSYSARLGGVPRSSLRESAHPHTPGVFVRACMPMGAHSLRYGVPWCVNDLHVEYLMYRAILPPYVQHPNTTVKLYGLYRTTPHAVPLQRPAGHRRCRTQQCATACEQQCASVSLRTCMCVDVCVCECGRVRVRACDSLRAR
jgi:hypothetical protein